MPLVFLAFSRGLRRSWTSTLDRYFPPGGRTPPLGAPVRPYPPGLRRHALHVRGCGGGAEG
eukprot:984586-Prorocentrum_minimum.AAC.1